MARRAAVYSSSRRSSLLAPPALPPAAPPPERFSGRKFYDKHRNALSRAGAALAVLLFLAAAGWIGMSPRGVSQDELNFAIQQALAAQNGNQLAAAEAYDKIRPSVVHVRGLAEETEGKKEEGEKKEKEANDEEGNVGTGVVIVDTGVILTNLHVVAGSKRIKVTFADGHEAEAEVTGVRPEHDLAVLQAKSIPDDLFAATIRSTNGLRPGDQVVAVGYPFGIGPSATAGVISGLKREYRSPQGKRILTNLIQFDAAVNPGNSGGPLVTLDGEVIGIVTGLLNPTEQRVFVGIGFAVPIENAAGAVGLSPF
jgi:S1-C subfamily serine protease